MINTSHKTLVLTKYFKQKQFNYRFNKLILIEKN